MSDQDFLTIDQLAREAGTTVRNVRAYQERGLLPPPDREGRVGVYGEGHLARLRLIASLAERGVLVRSGSALGRAGALRVTVGTEAENQKFLDQLGELL
jgi:hypothetical protein